MDVFIFMRFFFFVESLSHEMFNNKKKREKPLFFNSFLIQNVNKTSSIRVNLEFLYILAQSVLFGFNSNKLKKYFYKVKDIRHSLFTFFDSDMIN